MSEASRGSRRRPSRRGQALRGPQTFSGTTRHLTNRALIRFLLIAFVGAFAGQLVVIRLGIQGPARFALMIVMWMPGVAALFASAESRRLAWNSLTTPGWRLLAPAILIGWSVSAIQAGLLIVGFSGRWNNENFPLGDGQIRAEGVNLLLGNGWQGYGAFTLNWLLTLLVGSLVSIIPALGEELGWRAVLQPELERRMGKVTATIAVGLIWGYWHLPINLSGFNDSVHPVLTAALLFPLGSIFLSFPFAWLFRRSRSVWPPALCHGAGDAILGGLLVTSNSWVAENISLLLASVLIALPFMIVVIRQSESRHRNGAVSVESRAGEHRPE